jgi:ribosomal protein S18 acetylase RimI-like enzyme
MMRFTTERGFDAAERPAIVALLREYEAGIGVSLCFQDFDAEVANLPGDYAPPKGEMLVVRDTASGALVGCVAVRPVAGAPELCEMKRLYVRAAARGKGLGRHLALAAMAQARHLGYRRMCLDTLPTMLEAQALYLSLGFTQVGVSASEPQVLLFERDVDGG